MNWEYISGFFDADGSIYFTRNNKNSNKTIIISFTNTDLKLLQLISAFIQEKLAIKGSLSTKAIRNDKHTVGYDLKYTAISALKVLSHLTSIHKKKRHKIEVSKKFYEQVTIRNGKYSNSEKTSRIAFERLFYWSI